MEESNRNRLISLIDNQNIKKENIQKALELSNIFPSSKAWYKFIDQIILWFAGLSLALAMMFFIAYNWTEFGRFAKFALVEGVMILTMGLYWYLGSEKLSSKVLLLVSSIFLGVLLALFGQTYQTGADTWQLFFYWAMLMLPWAVVGRFAGIWMLWIVLLNLSIFLYMDTFGRLFWWSMYAEQSALWVFFIFNTFVFVLWEVFSTRFEWLNSPWAIRLLGYASGSAVTGLMLSFIWGNVTIFALLVWVAWLGAVYYVYRLQKVDLFMLAMGCFSFSTVIVSLLLEQINFRNFDEGLMLLISLVIIGLGTASAMWLKSVQKEAYNASK